MIKINMGCGWRNFGSDWIHIDGGSYSHLDSKDITKLPFGDNTVDLIYSSHVIEYFDREEVVPLLNEWRRVLKPDGVLRLAVPDFQSMAQLYTGLNYPIERFLGPLFGRMPMGDQTIYHKTAYDFCSMHDLLTKLEFRDIRKYDWKLTDHAQHDDHSKAYLPHMDKENGTLISLNVECIK